MREKSFKTIISVFLFIFLFTFVQNSFCKEDNGVRIRWEELKKLLKIDSDKISLELDDFRQILKQTGEDLKIPLSVEKGRVTLSRKDFTRLLLKMKTAEQITPLPVQAYSVNKAAYQGKMSAESTKMEAVFYLDIFKNSKKKYHTIPLIHSSAALVSVTADNKPALIVKKGSWYCITTHKRGSYTVKATYYVKSDIKKRPVIFRTPVVRTPITTFRLLVPLKEAELTVADSKDTTVKRVKDAAEIESVLTTTDKLLVRAYLKHKEEENKLPAKIYANTLTLLSIADNAVSAKSVIKLNILQNSVKGIKLRLPENFSIMGIKIDHRPLYEWKLLESGVTFIPFRNPLKKFHTLRIISEKLLEKNEKTFSFNGIKVMGTERESGYIGAEKTSTAHAVPGKTENLDLLDIKDLPSELINMSGRPLVFGYRYLAHPFKLEMSITKHKELPVINSVIDMANIITVVLPDGKILTKTEYTVRNTWKQFLKLKLKKDTEIMTLYVDRKRENASESSKGEILIPLARSKENKEKYTPFYIEMITLSKGNEQGLCGINNLQIPCADVLVSKLLWSVYLPEKFNYLNFTGNTEKEELAKTANLIIGRKRKINLYKADQYNEAARKYESGSYSKQNKIKSFGSVFSNLSISRKDMAQQMRLEANLNTDIEKKQSSIIGKPGAGSNIFKIDIPVTGQIYRFNKTIIENEPVSIEYTYISETGFLIIKIIAFLLILLLLFISGRRLIKFMKKRSGLRISLLISAIIVYHFSSFIFTILSVLFIISIFRPEWLLRDKKREAEEK